MKNSVESISDVEKKITVQIPKETIKKEIEDAYDMLKDKAQIKGFRKGKVPRNILEMHFKEQVQSDVLSKLINDSYSQALKDNRLDPVSYPKFDTDKFDINKDYSYKATVEVKPDLKVENHIGLELTKDDVNVTEKDIDDVINNLRSSQSILKKKEATALQKGDYAICEIEAFMDGKSITPEKGKTQNVEIGSEGINKDIEAALLKMKPGDETTVRSKLDDKLPDKKYAGKETEFKIKFKEIRERITPKADDEFARSLGPYKDLKDLREQAREQIKQQRDNSQKVKLQNDLMQKLIENNNFEIPKVMVDSEINYITSDAKMRMARSGLPEDKQKEEIEKSKDEIKKEAEKRVKQYLLLETIADKEKIEVNQNEVNARIEATAKSMNVPSDKIKEYYSRGNALSELKGQIRAEKTLDFIIKKANIKTVPAKTQKEGQDKK